MWGAVESMKERIPSFRRGTVAFEETLYMLID